MNDTNKLIASYLFSLSIFSLAAAIAYFAYEASYISKQIPDILSSINNTSEKIEPIIDEVNEIIDLVPAILKEVEETRKLIPPILQEVEQTRKMIPPILAEIEQTRKQIPEVLKETEAIRGELPAILASADKASDAVSDVSKQVKAIQPLIPEVLKEVETTRESIPLMLDRADVLIDKARVAGREASQGAVTGFFKGIILAPFALVGGAGKSIAGLSEKDAEKLSEKDFELIEQATIDLLNNGAKAEQRRWENPGNGTHGVVILVDIYEKDDFSDIECRTLDIELFKDGEEMENANRSLCMDEDGKWDFSE